MKNNILVIIIMTLLLSCNNKSDIQVIKLDKNTYSNAKNLEPKLLIDSDEFIHAKEFQIYSDSILIILNRPTADYPYFLEIRKLSDKSVIGKYFNKGNGPGEMLLAYSFLDNNILIIMDTPKQQLAFINMDSLLTQSDYKINLQKYNVQTDAINKMPDGKLVFENPYCYENKKINISNTGATRIFTDQNKQEQTIPSYQYYTCNITGGQIIVNKLNNTILYTSVYYPLIEFYDFNLNLKKQIMGPDNFNNQEYIFDKSEGNDITEVVFKNSIPFSYSWGCSNDDYIYLSYIGKQLEGKMEMCDFDSKIIKLDWAGNIIDSYYSDNSIKTVSISRDNKTIYATIYDKVGNKQLVSYQLN